MDTHFFLERLKTPLGLLLLATDAQERVRIVDWQDHADNMRELLRRQYPRMSITLQEVAGPSRARLALQAYFDGDLKAVDRLETATGGTDFQRQVWAELRAIPAGRTISYLELAHRIGRPQAVRAVGMANGANPISIVVPCHRVIGNKAALVGYGGGLERKRWLLEHEKAIQPAQAEAQKTLPGF